MKKIYIVGGVATGKTTFSKKLSKLLNIDCYELDNLVWNDSHSIKRSDEEREKMFSEILKKETWIIEDVGRKKFKRGLEEADTIYFLFINKYRIYFRVLKRWIKQKFKLEPYNYKPTIKGLFEMYGWAFKDIKVRKSKLNELHTYKHKLYILKEKDIKSFYKSNL